MNSNINYDKDFNYNNRAAEPRQVNLDSNEIDYSQGPSKIELPDNHSVVPPGPKKKNRTLQFYKFLFYSMKLEIKVHEFYDLIRFSNQSEISIWILSIVLYFNSPKSFSNAFVWIHILHLIRGIVGFLILLKLPRSYTVVESMKNISEKDMETKLFNDIARDVAKREIIDPLQSMKSLLIFYFILTFVNFVFDVIDFLYVLANIDKEGNDNDIKIILLSYLIIAFIYLGNIIFFYFSNRLCLCFLDKFT